MYRLSNRHARQFLSSTESASIRAESRAAEDVVGDACERVLAEIHTPKAFDGIVSAAIVAAVREHVAALPRKRVHQVLVVRMPCLDDVRDPPAPFVPHASGAARCGLPFAAPGSP